MRNESLRKRGRVYPNGEHDNSGDNNNRYYPHAPISQISLHRLLAFRRLANDPQGILTAIRRLALVGIELCLNIAVFELSVAPFTHTERRFLFYDPKFSFRHDCSLAQMAGSA